MKHKKAGSDARRSTLFSKFSRLLAAAARVGGPDPAANQKLRQAVDQARDAGMPKESIERAVARAAGASEGNGGIEREYEAYGPGGTALIITTLTDSPNRTTNELRHVLAGHGGRLGEGGSVSWMFRRQTMVVFSPCTGGEAAELACIDAGAVDTAARDGRVYAFVNSAELPRFLAAVSARGFTPERQSTVSVPVETIALEPADSARLAELLHALQDHPDTVTVVTNATDGPPLRARGAPPNGAPAL